MRILVSDPVSKEGVDALKAAGHDVDVKKLTPEELVAAIGDYDALVVRSETKVTKAVLAAGKRLKVVGRAGVGVDNVDLDAAKAQGVAVVNAPTAASNAVAELAIGHMLALLRHLQTADASVRAGKWEKKAFMGGEMAGRTLGLIGVGRIGGRVTELAKAFGMTVQVYDPYVTKERALDLGVAKFDDVVRLVRSSDIVSIHVPLTPETRHMVDAKLLAEFKPGAILVNCSRGGIVDEVAAAHALQEGRLGGLALDVFEEEPPKGTPVLAQVNARFTPHVGASTREAQDKAGALVAEQVNAVLAGKKAEFRVV